MKLRKVEISIILGVIMVIAGIGLAFNYSPKSEEIVAEEKSTLYKEYQILETWKLPKELIEISGISWLGDYKMACIQDEEGVIYIYNLKTSRIEKTIAFGEKGDYEGLVINKENAYALRSDGTIFEIENYNSPDFKTHSYNTFLEGKNNTESLALDAKNKRLLMAAKDKDPFSKTSKGIFEFDLKSKKLIEKPLFELKFDHKIFDNVREKKIKKTFSPSEIAIHPQSKEIYVLEGKKPKLLILNSNGSPKRLLELDKNDFRQPEGIAITPNGDVFISNEGKNKNAATILKVRLK